VRPIIILLMLLIAAGVWAGEKAGLLIYKVWEPDLEPYISRILVSPQYVRLDEGQDQGDFTLFHRKQGIIYNVSIDDESVLLISPAKTSKAPVPKLDLSEKTSIDAGAPLVSGRQPRQLNLFTNGELCRELVVIEGAMTDALTGLAEFQRALSNLQRITRVSEQVSVCEQSEFLYASDRSLKFGLPLHDSYMGKRQVLLDFKQRYDVAAELFSVPSSYREISMPGLSAE
jgi:hypothetical protein